VSDAIEIYARQPWYLGRPEQEGVWRGELRRREVPTGPAARTTLVFALVTEESVLPVYGARVEAGLAQFVDRTVVAHGKLVDLTAEGYGPELWVASIEAA
jgi:hypothetical protein